MIEALERFPRAIREAERSLDSLLLQRCPSEDDERPDSSLSSVSTVKKRAKQRKKRAEVATDERKLLSAEGKAFIHSRTLDHTVPAPGTEFPVLKSPAALVSGWLPSMTPAPPLVYPESPAPASGRCTGQVLASLPMEKFYDQCGGNVNSSSSYENKYDPHVCAVASSVSGVNSTPAGAVPEARSSLDIAAMEVTNSNAITQTSLSSPSLNPPLESDGPQMTQDLDLAGKGSGHTTPMPASAQKSKKTKARNVGGPILEDDAHTIKRSWLCGDVPVAPCGEDIMIPQEGDLVL